MARHRFGALARGFLGSCPGAAARPIDEGPWRGWPMAGRATRIGSRCGSDELPCFFLPHTVQAAARQVDAAVELVDGNGLLPRAAADRASRAQRRGPYRPAGLTKSLSST